MDIEDSASEVLISKTTVDMNKYSFNFPYFQNFSIPRNIIYYILKNPNGTKGYQNLMKTCKYFYSKNPIIFVDYAKIDMNSATWFCWRKTKINISTIGVIKLKCKFWINGTLGCLCNLPPLIIFEKIIHLTNLYIFWVSFSLNKFMSFHNLDVIKNFELDYCVINNTDGWRIPNEVLEMIPDVKVIRG